MKLLEKFPVNQAAAPPERILQPALINKPDQIKESPFIAGKQNQMIPAGIVGGDTGFGILNKIYLTAQDRMDIFPAAGAVKSIDVIEYAVIGDGDGVLTDLFEPGYCPFSVQDAIGIGAEKMAVEVGEHRKVGSELKLEVS